MPKNKLWSDKKNNRHRKTNREYEGGAEKLLQYAEAHPSERELAQLKINTELRRWSIELRPPTIQEIQQRYNFTFEYAEKFLKKLEKARILANTKPEKTMKKGVGDAPSDPLQAVNIRTPKEFKGKDTRSFSEQFQVILADIRKRYGDEIRQSGEQTSVQEGFIYLVTNLCFPGWVKAGMTIDFELRIGTYNTSDPLSRFEYAKLSWTPNRRTAERKLLAALQNTALETRGEWFKIQLQEAAIVFDLQVSYPTGSCLLPE